MLHSEFPSQPPIALHRAHYYLPGFDEFLLQQKLVEHINTKLRQGRNPSSVGTEIRMLIRSAIDNEALQSKSDCFYDLLFGLPQEVLARLHNVCFCPNLPPMRRV
jgi:hypothetical protein